jgi:hypothetical protein
MGAAGLKDLWAGPAASNSRGQVIPWSSERAQSNELARLGRRNRELPDRRVGVCPLLDSGFLSAGCYYHCRVSDKPEPMSRWEVFKFIFLGIFISAVLTALVVFIAVRAAKP